MRCAAGVVLVIAVLGCGKSKEEQDKESAKRIQEREAAEAAQKKESDEANGKSRKQLVDQFAAFEAIIKSPKRAPSKLPAAPPPDATNTIVLPADPAEAHGLITGTKQPSDAWWSWSDVQTRIFQVTSSKDAGASTDMFALLKTAKYLALLSSVDYARPYVATSGSGYYPGKRVAEVRLYALPAGAYLGGVRFEAKTDARIETTGDVDKALEIQLAAHVTDAMYAALAKGGTPVAFNVGWTALQSKGMGIELPPHWELGELDPKNPEKLVAGKFGVEDAYQSIGLYEEAPATTFTPDAACGTLAAAYAKELKSTVKTAAIEQVDGAPTCLATLEWEGKRAERLRYWEQGGKKYSLLCEAPLAFAGLIEQCDRIWASRMPGQ